MSACTTFCCQMFGFYPVMPIKFLLYHKLSATLKGEGAVVLRLTG